MSFDTYTKSLLHLDGADAATSFTDEKGLTWTAHGNAQLDTAQKKFGATSLLVDGVGDYIDTPDASSVELGSSDWTIDFWFKYSGSNGNTFCGLACKGNNAGQDSWNIGFSNVGNSIFFDASIDGSPPSTFMINVGASTRDGNWHHVAVVRFGNNGYVFVDGVHGFSTGDFTGITIFNGSSTLKIGTDQYSSGFNGWIDEFRLSIGIARWTTDFTPPSSAYVDFIKKIRIVYGE